MATFTIDNPPTSLTVGDKIIFSVRGEDYEYEVNSDFLGAYGYDNDIIFHILRQDKHKFLEKAYGYLTHGGDWPQTRDGRDLQALLRAVWLLFAKIGNQKRHPIPLEEIINLREVQSNLDFLGFETLPVEIIQFYLEKL